MRWTLDIDKCLLATALEVRKTLNRHPGGRDYVRIVETLKVSFPNSIFNRTNVRRRANMLMWLPNPPDSYIRGPFSMIELVKLRNGVLQCSAISNSKFKIDWREISSTVLVSRLPSDCQHTYTNAYINKVPWACMLRSALLNHEHVDMLPIPSSPTDHEWNARYRDMFVSSDQSSNREYNVLTDGVAREHTRGSKAASQALTTLQNLQLQQLQMQDDTLMAREAVHANALVAGDFRAARVAFETLEPEYIAAASPFGRASALMEAHLLMLLGETDRAPFHYLMARLSAAPAWDVVYRRQMGIVADIEGLLVQRLYDYPFADAPLVKPAMDRLLSKVEGDTLRALATLSADREVSETALRAAGVTDNLATLAERHNVSLSPDGTSLHMAQSQGQGMSEGENLVIRYLGTVYQQAATMADM
ncbi:hypothetical protein KIPB_002515 [Kipferlia bialata]|uniref:Uncharacterized protein n=1 Tax=Kipferlia bialata TaxID=797122 RepID=A0A9K3GGB5_9EUKA|nr:hypothetical protein KIPB_002515 [Kipferlia bialata]|eukprot:g2515.t1